MRKENVNINHFTEITFRQNLWNYDNPLAQKTVNGINFRIAEGFIIDKKKSYILYKDSKLVGTYTSVEEAKEFAL